MNRLAMVLRIDVWSKTMPSRPKTVPPFTHGEITNAGTRTPYVPSDSGDTLVAAGGGTWS
jgi:hypothetical protein